MFWRKPKITYGLFLKGHTEVVGKQPAMVRSLAEDIDLELYLGASWKGKNTWVTAVISVRKGKKIFKTKYDGGMLKEMPSVALALEDMAADCMFYLKHSWNLNHFRKMLK